MFPGRVQKSNMSKLFENLKSGINEKKTAFKFSKSLKRLGAIELSSPLFNLSILLQWSSIKDQIFTYRRECI
jgi:hypothetical protein